MIEKAQESEKSLTPEERQQLRREMLKQASVKLENARVNYVMAKAAYEALLADEDG